jgi:hypothetical protein
MEMEHEAGIDISRLYTRNFIFIRMIRTSPVFIKFGKKLIATPYILYYFNINRYTP